MKELSIIIKPEKLETLKQIIEQHKCHGMTISTVMGCGTQKGYREENEVHQIKGMNTNINLLPKIRVDVVAADSKIKELCLDICDQISTGNVGDGKIFVRNIEEAVRIRTGERGEKAL